MPKKMTTKQTYVLAVAALSALLAVPAAAHHNSLDPSFVEEHMPDDALEQHNLAVDEVLDMGVAQMAGGVVDSGMTLMTRDQASDDMDPADSYSGTMSTVTDPYEPFAPHAVRNPPLP